MKLNRSNKLPKNPFFAKNWEQNIKQVSVEACDRKEDPLGYRAIFFTRDTASQHDVRDDRFVIGASYLAQREFNLSKAGYKAPMTSRAINLIEQKLGSTLPVVLA